MEKICEHCRALFTVKRKDVVYCSASCRQMAYLSRRLNTQYTNEINKRVQLHDASNHKPSIDELQNREDNNEPSIDVLENNHSETTNNIKTSNSSLINEPTQAYKDIKSHFLTEISELSNQRDYIFVLNSCLYVHKNMPCYEVSERLKCLTECLLLFSEMKSTDIEDLKEIGSAHV